MRKARGKEFPHSAGPLHDKCLSCGGPVITLSWCGRDQGYMHFCDPCYLFFKDCDTAWTIQQKQKKPKQIVQQKKYRKRKDDGMETLF